MKVLRICRQGGDVSVYDSKEQLRRGLIDLHMDDILSDEETDKTYIEKYKKWSLDQICNMFDWSYEIITDKVNDLEIIVDRKNHNMFIKNKNRRAVSTSSPKRWNDKTGKWETITYQHYNFGEHNVARRTPIRQNNKRNIRRMKNQRRRIGRR